MGIRRETLVKMTWPSSSTENNRLPRGVKPILEMFFRCANGRVCDLFLVGERRQRLRLAYIYIYIYIYIYTRLDSEGGLTNSTRLKTVTLFPTGEKRHVPSGLNKRFP